MNISVTEDINGQKYVRVEQEPSYNLIKTELSGDLISRQAVLDIVDSYSESRSNVEDVTQDIISDIVALPYVNPQEPKTDVLDKIRAEIEEVVNENKTIYSNNSRAQNIGLMWVLRIINKYKAESEG